MTVNMNTLIGTPKLMATINSPAMGLKKAFDEKFFSLRENADSQTFKWEQVPITQTTAAAVSYGSPARPAPKTDMNERDGRCIHLFESLTHSGQTLVDLQSDVQETRDRAAGDFTRQAVNFGLRFDNTEIASVASVLSQGVIYQGSNGHIQLTSSGAARTISLGRPAANMNQCGGLITASWATAGTDILGNILSILAAMSNAGRPCKKIMYGTNIPGYMRGNTAISGMSSKSSWLADQLAQSRLPVGFGDPANQVVWEPIWNSFFKDASGTTRTFFDGDAVLFLPEVDKTWYTMVDGAAIVPTKVGLAGNPAEAAASLKKVRGKFSYARINDNPVSVDQFFGHSFLPVLLDPAAFYTADVIP